LTTGLTCNVTGTVASLDLKQNLIFDKNIPCGNCCGEIKNVSASGSTQNDVWLTTLSAPLCISVNVLFSLTDLDCVPTAVVAIIFVLVGQL
jgi:hypothetical protein